ncbi:MAG: energy transducer TonB, partial [Sinomicrobium sp.]|nr:energy transducer TonB [Sinomicrobium sp.]
GRRGLSGVQKIYTQFHIDTRGNVTEIKTSSKHPFLAEEAERVIGLIPRMQPARQRDRAVKVVFTMPIVFKVQE